MANVIKPKRTTVAGRVPTTANIAVGEIALNMADSILYFRDTSDNIKSVSSGLATVGTAGTYTKVTTDDFGRVTAGTTLIASDVPTLNQNTTGNAGTATTLQTARTITLAGDATGSVSFDGSANVTIPVVIADDSHNHTKLAGNPHIVRDLNALIRTTVQDGELHYHAYSAGSNGGVGMTDNANGVITVGQHSSGYNSQISFSSDGHLYWRESIGGGTPTAWQKIWKDGSDGSGSGLDADLLDGLQSSSVNTVSTIVARDASGNFSAGTITATLNGNATTATTATTATKLGSTTIGSSTLPMYLNAGTATACSTTLGVSITGSSASCTGNAATVTNGVYTNSSASFSGDVSHTFGPNSTWGAYLRVGGNGRTASGTMASVATTNGNLHLDASTGAFSTYLNYYAGTGGTMFGNGSSGIVAVMGPDGDLWKGSSDNSGTQYVYNSGTWGINVTGNAATATTAYNVSATSDQAIVNQSNGNTTAWYGRILSKNSTSDKAAFLGTYGTIAGVFSHNNALSAWADLYVNTVDGSSGGAVRIPNTTYMGGNLVLNAGNYTSYSPSLTGSGASGTWGISVTGNAATATKLATARTINGVSFDGTANITITASESTTITEW